MADKISENSVSEIWKRGVPLRDAPGAFGVTAAMPKLVREARRDARALSELGKRNARKAGLDWDAGYDAFGSILSYTKESSSVGIAKMARLLERLVQGDLVAVGFSVTATAKEPPQEVPIHLLERRFIKLNKDEIQSEHFHFRQVRIAVRQSAENEGLASSGLPATKRGPESAGDTIRQIHSDLIRTGEIPSKHTLKEAWVIVRDRIKRDYSAQFPGDRGLSYSSFARHINGP